MNRIAAIALVLGLAACSDDPNLNAAYINAAVSGFNAGRGQSLPMVTITHGTMLTQCLNVGTPQSPILAC